MPSWRPLTWFILVAQAPFAIWLIVALAGSDTDCPEGEFQEFCQSGAALGTTIGVVLVLAIWAMADVILGVCWLVTNDAVRRCPQCGARSKNGLLACPSCNGEFVAAPTAMKSPTKTCPECAELVLATAKVCRYCTLEFPTANSKCPHCAHVQAVLKDQIAYTCEECGKSLKRKTG